MPRGGLATAVARATLAMLVVAPVACTSLPSGALDRTMRGQSIEGRMSVRYKDLASGRQDASSGRFVWTTSGEDLELSLLDPLGQTVALIRARPEHASIVFRDGRTVEGTTPESLTATTLGWTVPLSGLRHWLAGESDPARPSTTLSDGRLSQDGWAIRFQRESDATADADANAPPRRVDLFFAGPPAEIELRLVVDTRTTT